MTERVLASLVLLLVAVPAFGQSRVYTNADLGRPVEWRQAVPREVLAGLIERQFALPPPSPTGPTALIIPYDGSRDFPGSLPLGPDGPFSSPFYAPMPYSDWPYGISSPYAPPFVYQPLYQPFYQPRFVSHRIPPVSSHFVRGPRGPRRIR